MNKKIISLLLTAGILGAVGGNTVISFCSAETENAPITAETETMTEEKLRELLPRTMSEFSKFTAKNGTVSIYGKYIVYCDEINYSTGAEVVMEQLGTAEVKKAFGYDIKLNKLPAPGDPGYTVIVYEAISSGTVEITISQGQPWAWEESHEVKDLGYYEVDEEMNVSEISAMTEEKLRELLPKTMDEFNEFTAKNGTVSVYGRYIVYCDEINYSTGAEVVMEQLGTAEVTKAFEYDITPDEPLAPGAPSYTVIVYEAISSGTVEITISQGMPWAWEQSHKVKDHGYYEVDEEMNVSEISTETMTEEKLREILPKTMAEFNKFSAKNGTVSVYGKYIVYCDEINYSTGAAVVMEQIGTAEVKKAFEYDITPDDLTMIGDGDPSHTVIVYEAISSGTVEITISQGQPWAWEQSHKVKDHGYYKVNEEMNVSKISKEEFTPPVRGDVNGDGDFTVADLVMLEKWLLGNGELTSWKNADLSKDSVIDVYDLCVMRKEISESQPDYTVLNVEAVRGLGSIEKIQNSIYTASSMSELYAVLKTAELCEYDGCKCAFHDVQALVPNGIDESFFKNNVLIAVYNAAGGSNKVLTIDKLEKSNELLTVYTTTTIPELATPDMAYYRGFIAVSKTYFEGVSKVERNDTYISIKY